MCTMYRLLKRIIAVFLLTTTALAYAEVSVIVHPNNQAEISLSDIKRIFLGMKRSYPNGNEAIPISYQANTELSKEFSKKVLDKSSHQLKAYWAKRLFTGKGTPPKVMDNIEHIVILVANNPSLIGFVPSDAVNETVRVVDTY